METIKKNFIAIILFLVVTNVTAQTAKIDNTWLEHNVTENGQNGMIIHTVFSVQNMMNRKGSVQVWFYSANDVQLMGYGKQHYKTPKGFLSASKSFTPNYERTNFSDFKIFFPYDELKKSVNNVGTYDLKYKVDIIDDNNYRLTSSNFANFQYTNSNNSNATPPTEERFEQRVIDGADYYDSNNLSVETKKGQILKDITSDEMGSISAPNLYEFRTENGEVINASFKNRLPSTSGKYQITGSFKTAYLNGVMSTATVFYVTSFKKL